MNIMSDLDDARPKHAVRRLTHSCGIALAAIVSASLFEPSMVHAQSVRVTASNSSNSVVYDVNFSGAGGSITPLNTDANKHVSLQGLTFRADTSGGKIDLIVADTSRGELLIYPNATGQALVVWSPTSGVYNVTEGLGPVHPNGLSVDASGNLFVVSSAPGNSTNAEVWVLPRTPAGPLPGGYGLPRLVDNDFGGIAVQLLEETESFGSSTAFAGPSDLLVLASDPATLFRYPAHAVQTVLQGMGQIDPEVRIASNQFPSGAEPGGFAFWPQDGSVLITTGDGRILRYSAAGAPLADFATGLGNGKFKIKTGLEFGNGIAVVADNNGGDILKFGAPSGTGTNPPLARITSGVQSPRGLAVSNIGIAFASTCLESAGGCDPLGGVLKHEVRGPQTLQGAVIEKPCVLQTDPRITEFGTCTGHTLIPSNYCAGMPNVVIPDYLCGSSGTSGHGFALIDATRSASTAQPALIINEAMSEGILPGSGNATCPQEVLGWAPKAGEGTIVEGDVMVEMTGFCGSSGAFTRDWSIWGVGLALNEDALPGATRVEKYTNFAYTKYDTLAYTVTTATITEKIRKRLQSCISSSRAQLDRGRVSHAAAELLTCDSLVVQNQNAFAASATNPNPYGEVRGRLANLYLTLDARILGNPAAATWPPGP